MSPPAGNALLHCRRVIGTHLIFDSLILGFTLHALIGLEKSSIIIKNEPDFVLRHCKVATLLEMNSKKWYKRENLGSRRREK